MILSNLHFTTFLLFIGLLILSSIILNLLYKREKNKNLFILFLAFIFLIINIFEIKGGYNKELRNIE
jgi:divalent metal cation (Fe/Co/Zn/Cd) transporter